MGLEARRRKRQVERSAQVKITSADRAVELEVRRSDRDSQSPEGGHDRLGKRDVGVVAKQRTRWILEIRPGSESPQNDVDAADERIVAGDEGAHQRALEMLEELGET